MIKKPISASLAVFLAIYPLLYIQAATPAFDMPETTRSLPADTDDLSAEQLDNLLAPIALYPDPLLAQMLPASTFVDQIDQAARYLRANNNQSVGVDNQVWDISVKSIAHYPQVVYSMSEKLDWTTALGQAYVMQTEDLFKSIQRLRERAKKAGYLVTTPQQEVIVEKGIIKIVPAQAQIIYVPTYNPQVVYVETSSGISTGEVVAATAIAFGVGLAIGAWLNNDCNWNSYSVFYHGWRGVGWVSNSSAFIRVNNNYYVNNRYGTINVNRTVINRNVNYNNINRYNNVSRNINYTDINRNNVNRNNVNRNDINNNFNRNINNNKVNDNQYRGKVEPTTGQIQNRANRTNSAFSDTRNGNSSRIQSQRGQTSRQSADRSRTTRTPRVGGGRGRRN